MTRDLFLIKRDGRRDQPHLYLWCCARESAKKKGQVNGEVGTPHLEKSFCYEHAYSYLWHYAIA